MNDSISLGNILEDAVDKSQIINKNLKGSLTPDNKNTSKLKKTYQEILKLSNEIAKTNGTLPSNIKPKRALSENGKITRLERLKKQHALLEKKEAYETKKENFKSGVKSRGKTFYQGISKSAGVVKDAIVQNKGGVEAAKGITQGISGAFAAFPYLGAVGQATASLVNASVSYAQSNLDRFKDSLSQWESALDADTTSRRLNIKIDKETREKSKLSDIKQLEFQNQIFSKYQNLSSKSVEALHEAYGSGSRGDVNKIIQGDVSSLYADGTKEGVLLGDVANEVIAAGGKLFGGEIADALGIGDKLAKKTKEQKEANTNKETAGKYDKLAQIGRDFNQTTENATLKLSERRTLNRGDSAIKAFNAINNFENAIDSLSEKFVILADGGVAALNGLASSIGLIGDVVKGLKSEAQAKKESKSIFSRTYEAAKSAVGLNDNEANNTQEGNKKFTNK